MLICVLPDCLSLNLSKGTEPQNDWSGYTADWKTAVPRVAPSIVQVGVDRPPDRPSLCLATCTHAIPPHIANNSRGTTTAWAPTASPTPSGSPTPPAIL